MIFEAHTNLRFSEAVAVAVLSGVAEFEVGRWMLGVRRFLTPSAAPASSANQREQGIRPLARDHFPRAR